MPFIRHELGRRLRIKRIPELHVRLDDTAERGTRVLHLLSELEEGRTRDDRAARRIAPDAGPRLPHEGDAADAEPAAEAAAGRPSRDRRHRRAAARQPRAAPAARARTGTRPGRGERRAPKRDDRRDRPGGPARDAVPARGPRPARAARDALVVATRTPTRTRWARRSACAGSSRRFGGRATPVCTDPVPPLYAFLPGIERFRTDPDPGGDVRPARPVDCGTRTGSAPSPSAIPSCSRCRASIIDHHASNDATAAPPTGSTRPRRRRARWSRCSRRGSASRSRPAKARSRPR